MAEELYKGFRNAENLRTVRQIVRVHIDPALGHVNLKGSTPAALQGLYREKLDSGLSPRTVQYVHATFSKALKEAAKWRLVPCNVTEAVDPPSLLKKEEIRSLNLEQAKAFLRVVKGNRLEALCILAVSAG